MPIKIFEMPRFLLVVAFLVFSIVVFSQKSIDKALERYNDGSIAYITVDDLNRQSGAVLLDTRKKEEFEVSHLENAIWVGFRKFDIKDIQRDIPNKETPIVVYCSIGVRSEKIGKKLQEAGYSNIKNLYGGIFEWVNKGNAVVDTLNHQTDNIHAFSKQWGRLLTKGEKIYNAKPIPIEKPF